MLDLRIMNTQDEISDVGVALEMLKTLRGNIIDVAIVAKSAWLAGRGKLKRALQCIAMGEKVIREQEKTVSFSKAVDVAIEERKIRRSRTLCDFRYITKRFMKRCKGLSCRRIRSIRPGECRHYIEEAFSTPSQRKKARAILSGVFSTAIKNGWCSENPVAKVELFRVNEERISILQPKDIHNLMVAAKEHSDGNCLAAVGIMLYAGVRPHEVERLNWEHVDLENDSIIILPQHSKTGGARLVSIKSPLKRLLKDCKRDAGRICPPQWQKHWRELRRQAGFIRWQPDVLRHTFASYHLRYFQNYQALQYEMGHRDSTLLRSRYVDLRGVQNAAEFWS